MAGVSRWLRFLPAGRAGIPSVVGGSGLGGDCGQVGHGIYLIKWVGVIYLVWLGIQKWRETTTLDVAVSSVQVPAWQLFRQAVMVNLTNPPKTIVFLVALFPQFLNPAEPQLLQLTVLGDHDFGN